MFEGINLMLLRPVIYSLALICCYIWGPEGLIISLGISYFVAEFICDLAEERRK